MKSANGTVGYIVFLALVFSSCMKQTSTLQTVPHVDLNRYAGKWYEIASYPQRFQKGCHCTTAEYTPTDKGYIEVKNKCNRDSVNGKATGITGKAFTVKNSGNAKLKVQFFWPFKGDYWIIELADDYSHAVVSSPDRNYLWILSRTPAMDLSRYDAIIDRLVIQGFDKQRIKKTVQCSQSD